MGAIQTERFRTGNRVQVFFRGDGANELLGTGVIGALGDATSGDGSIDLGVQPVYVMGDPKPQELVDTRYSYSFRLSRLQLVSREAADIINAGSVEIETVDRYNGKPILTARGCKLTNKTINLPANQLATENLQFMALSMDS